MSQEWKDQIRKEVHQGQIKRQQNEAAFKADPSLQPRLKANRQAVWPEVEARAAEWTLLLQVSRAALMKTRLLEGQIYYMIRKADLAARNFSRVNAIYQQT